MRDLLIKIQTYRYNSYMYMSHILYRQVSSCNFYRQDYVSHMLCIICYYVLRADINIYIHTYIYIYNFIYICVAEY